MTLRLQIDEMARRFAEDVAKATIAEIMNGASARMGESLGELADMGIPVHQISRDDRIWRPIGTRRARSSPETIASQKKLVLRAARRAKPGFSRGDILGKVDGFNVGRILGLLVEDGELKRKGDRKLTRYWLAS